MASPDANTDINPDQELEIDHLVDTSQASYSEARSVVTGEPIPREPTAREKARTDADDFYTREFHLTGAEPLTDVERERNRIGKAAVLAAWAEGKQKRD